MKRFAALILILTLGSVPGGAEDQSKDAKVDFTRIERDEKKQFRAHPLP